MNVGYLLCLFAHDMYKMYNVQIVLVVFHSNMMKTEHTITPYLHLSKGFSNAYLWLLANLHDVSKQLLSFAVFILVFPGISHLCQNLLGGIYRYSPVGISQGGKYRGGNTGQPCLMLILILMK